MSAKRPPTTTQSPSTSQLINLTLGFLIVLAINLALSHPDFDLTHYIPSLSPDTQVYIVRLLPKAVQTYWVKQVVSAYHVKGLRQQLLTSSVLWVAVGVIVGFLQAAMGVETAKVGESREAGLRAGR